MAARTRPLVAGSVAGLVALVSCGVLPSAVGAPATAATASTPHHRLAVTGFQEEGNRNRRVTASAKALTTVGVDGVNVSADGRSVVSPDAGARRVLALAHRHHLRAVFLVGNFGQHDFSEPYAHRLLSRAAHRVAVVSSLARSVRNQGWDGISVDLESLRGRDRAGLTDFLRELRAALPAGKTLSVCLMSYTSNGRYRRAGYNLSAIAKAVTTVTLMTYDQHGPWESKPGPVGGLRWQRRSLAALHRSVPDRKIDLGQAGYGYAWRPHRTVLLSDAGARSLARREGRSVRFDRAAGEWTARLRDGSTLWWADARSYRLRVAIARRHHLHGLAVWSLGLSDRIR